MRHRLLHILHTNPSKERHPMSRILRVLAALFMVPVVMLANSTTASAAASPWQQVNISAEVTGSQGWVGRDCTFNARHTGSAVQVGANGYCIGLPDASPGSTQPAEAGSSYALQFNGVDAAGTECVANMGGTLSDHPNNGTITVAGTIQASTANLLGGADGGTTCTVTEACITLMDTEQACVPVNLVPPGEEPASLSCTKGTANPPPEDRMRQAVDGNWAVWQYTWNMTGDTTDLGNGGAWIGYVVLRGAADNQPAVGAGVQNATKTRIVMRRVERSAIAGTPWGGGEVDAQVSVAKPQPWDDAPNVIGRGAFYVGPDDLGSLNNGAPWFQAYAETFGPGESRYRIGMTNPARCFWYWGEKISNDDPHTDWDESEPVAPLIGDPTEDPDETEEPPIVPPTPVEEPEDEKSWLGLIWAVLQSVWNSIKDVVSAVKGVAAAVVNGIKNMMSGLFLPSDGYLESKWSGVENKWASTTPSKYVDAVSDFDPGGASGCQGLPLKVQLAPGVRIDEHVGAACSGTMATAAGTVRVFITAAVGIGGMFACVRALGSGLGWDPGLGRGQS